MQAVGVCLGWNHESVRLGGFSFETSIPWLEIVRVWHRDDAPSKEGVAALLAEQMELREEERDIAFQVWAVVKFALKETPPTDPAYRLLTEGKARIEKHVWNNLGLSLRALDAQRRADPRTDGMTLSSVPVAFKNGAGRRPLLLVLVAALTLSAPASADPWRIHAARQARIQTWACERRLVVVARTGYPTVKWGLPVVERRVATLRYWRRARASCGRSLRLAGPVSAWLCIHRHEGAWNDPNPPYFGGLQMDRQFQRTYGRELYITKGTADRWTPVEQMVVAERARRSGRGFYPWPNAARLCGLI